MITYQINTLRKDTLEVLKYLYKDESFDFIEYFNLNKAFKLPELDSIKYLIEIDSLVLYSLLYNLSKI